MEMPTELEKKAAAATLRSWAEEDIGRGNTSSLGSAVWTASRQDTAQDAARWLADALDQPAEGYVALRYMGSAS